ncbi:thiol:disulfide interchange protein DsbA/DsbL [Rheinheimera sediminis]|uniref:thiol:disulfide interchange protein DsbA/DsbL n=1 Tax=Rheinheimera sp. YQF-1 TaxID=2499626 RepID=UPI000FD7385E|nr:thiol:disulfide interchange protein DsbA/DsbL [Rheinheimera sp. YQF-1]RVT47516.1 thiol:disulfide interchange protein DsbA/DsbL [Rheinheimera sp. YQF-1]
MLKTLLFALLFAPLAAFASAAAPVQYQQGVHYDVVAEKATEVPEVLEFFSFYCPHCKAFEPFAQTLDKNLPSGVKLTKHHVDFLRVAPPELQQSLAKAYVVAKNAGQGDRIADAIFDYLHLHRGSFTTEQDIRSLLVANDIPAMLVDSGMVNPAVVAEVDAMKRSQDHYSEAKVLQGVPTLLVNGKYQVKFSGLSKDNFQQDLNDLVAFLLAKKD